MTTAIAPSAHPAASPSTYTFDGQAVRVITRDGEPWFVAADVCGALNIANNRDAVAKLDDDEIAAVGLTDTSSNGVTQRREVTLVSESGLYTLILRSRDATTPGTVAHRFRKWVTGEVLPSLRRSGRYAVAAPAAPRTALDEPLTGNDLKRLTRLVWLIAQCGRHQAAWTQATWKALRLATGVPAPNRFQVRHLPALSEELRRIWRAALAYREAAGAAETRLLKHVLRERGALEPILAQCQQQLTEATREGRTELATTLSAWSEREIAALLDRTTPAGGRYDGYEEVLP